MPISPLLNTAKAIAAQALSMAVRVVRAALLVCAMRKPARVIIIKKLSPISSVLMWPMNTHKKLLPNTNAEYSPACAPNTLRPAKNASSTPR